MSDIEIYEHERSLWEKAQAEKRRERDSLLGVLSPADQHLIGTVENGHLTLPDFQRKHGLVADGIMGPKTRDLIEELAHKRKNDAEIARIAKLAGRDRERPCTAVASFYGSTGEKFGEVRCDKGDHDPLLVPHRVTYEKWRPSWGTPGDAYFQWDALGWNQWNPLAYPPKVQPKMSPGGIVVNKVEGIQMPLSPNVAKVMVKEGDRATVKKVVEKHNARKGIITKEQYLARFSEMQYTVVRAQRFGFLAIVTLARGGERQYWRSTKAWAERVGVRRLKRELSILNADHDRSNPEGVRARDLGFHPIATTEEVTALLAEQEANERRRQQEEWDAQFNGEAKAS